MIKSLSFWTGGLSSINATGAKRIAMILSAALFCWATSMGAGSLATSHILVPLTWAQSESLEGQGGEIPDDELMRQLLWR
jgi:hypothetical protein